MDLEKGVKKYDLKDHEVVLQACCSPNSKSITSLGNNKDIKTWDLEKGVEKQTIVGQCRTICYICYLPDGKFLAYGGMIALFIERSIIKLFLEHVDDVVSMCFSPDSSLLALGYGSGRITIWDIKRLLINV